MRVSALSTDQALSRTSKRTAVFLAQRMEQRPGLLEVGGVKARGEAAIHLRQLWVSTKCKAVAVSDSVSTRAMLLELLL